MTPISEELLYRLFIKKLILLVVNITKVETS